jgi:hypothetical protein
MRILRVIPRAKTPVPPFFSNKTEAGGIVSGHALIEFAKESFPDG